MITPVTLRSTDLLRDQFEQASIGTQLNITHGSRSGLLDGTHPSIGRSKVAV